MFTHAYSLDSWDACWVCCFPKSKPNGALVAINLIVLSGMTDALHQERKFVFGMRFWGVGGRMPADSKQARPGPPSFAWMQWFWHLVRRTVFWDRMFGSMLLLCSSTWRWEGTTDIKSNSPILFPVRVRRPIIWTCCKNWLSVAPPGAGHSARRLSGACKNPRKEGHSLKSGKRSQGPCLRHFTEQTVLWRSLLSTNVLCLMLGACLLIKMFLLATGSPAQVKVPVNFLKGRFLEWNVFWNPCKSCMILEPFLSYNLSMISSFWKDFPVLPVVFL